MDDSKRNGIMSESSRLDKLEIAFFNDRDSFYRASLHNLQNALATLQQGTNEDFLEKKQDLEEQRDYELTRLRLWEEYRVKRIDEEYREDLGKAKENHDKMIKLIKEKLYDKLQKQIKQLKEDKLLLNLVNANSWNSVNLNDSAIAALNSATGSLTDRRSLRKREISSRFTTGEIDDLSDSGIGNSTTAAEMLSGAGYGSGSSATNGNKRRRFYATRYSSNDENNGGSHSHHRTGNGHSQVSSGNESNLSDKDYDALNSLIMNDEGNGMSSVLLEQDSNGHRMNTRGSHKQFTGPQGLKPEELHEDLALIRNAIVKKE
ncbi:uncharacterized protein PRCAT00005200001 [Priceomyces carsonii]|uniref:uncharacterized protein n=1 Tax=Priceomyces carsonii TaxID=28549 RepID=UPI002EDB2F30|nr:unnamed protein product [Priceomyces carsonii]